jgi:hypothetical protein
VVINCLDGKVVGIEPILYKVKHPENWEDLRKNSSLIFC